MKTQRSWPLAIGILLWAAAIFAGVYMTQHHEVQLFGSAEMQTEIIGCVESAKVSCNIVNTSDWSELFGIPLFTLAVPFYGMLIALGALAMAGKRGALWLIGGLGVFASVFSIFLGYISYVELGKVCMWCVRLYGISFATPVLALIAGMLGAKKPGNTVLGTSAAVYLVLAVLSIGVQRNYRAGLLANTEGVPALPSTADVDTIESSDGEGEPPLLSWEVTTEKQTKGTLTISPDDAWKGAPDAKIAVVEFADFECGYCKRASGQLKRLFEAYGDRVAFVFKHFPMDPKCNPGVNNPKHRRACMAAEGGVCAQKQGKFWKYHDLLFKNQHDLKSEALLQYATAAGVDVSEWKRCMTSGEGKAKVKADGEAGKAIEIHGTPRIWINGKLYRAGTSAEQMARQIELALGASAADAAKSASAMKDVGKASKIAAISDDVPEMITITSNGKSFQIDTFEAALDNGTAKSGKHLIPARHMSWFAANDACKAAGKRMCSEEEWLSACQGAPAIDDDKDGQFADDMVEGWAYPYGELHEPGRCWDGKDKGAACTRDFAICGRKPGADLEQCAKQMRECTHGNGYKYRPVYTGEMPGCVSKQGVYDLTGNVEEWVGTSASNAVLLGGAFDTTKDKARCYRRNETFGAGYANQRIGFRCCK